MDLRESAEFVRKGLDLLGDELHEAGLDEHAHRCTQMAAMLSRSLYGTSVRTAPIDLEDEDG